MKKDIFSRVKTLYSQETELYGFKGPILNKDKTLVLNFYNHLEDDKDALVMTIYKMLFTGDYIAHISEDIDIDSLVKEISRLHPLELEYILQNTAGIYFITAIVYMQDNLFEEKVKGTLLMYPRNYDLIGVADKRWRRMIEMVVPSGSAQYIIDSIKYLS